MPLHSAHLHSCRAICWFMRIIKIPESLPVLFQMFSPAPPPRRPLPLGLSNACTLFVGNWNSPCLLWHCVGLSKTRITLLVDSYVQTCIYSVSTLCGCVPEECSQADKTQILLPLSVYHAFQIPTVLACLAAVWVHYAFQERALSI